MSYFRCKSMQNDDIGICFSGGAAFFFYFLGIAKTIQKHFDLAKVTFCGSSAGALAAFFLASGYNINRIFQKLILPGITSIARVDQELGTILLDRASLYFSNDDLTRVNYRLHVIITKIDSLGYIQVKDITKWKNNDDLLESLYTSCFIPYIAANRLFNTYRGSQCLDGSTMNILRSTKQPPTAHYKGRCKEWIYISPSSFSSLPKEILSGIGAAMLLNINDDSMVNALYHLGVKHANENLGHFDRLPKKARKRD